MVPVCVGELPTDSLVSGWFAFRLFERLTKEGLKLAFCLFILELLQNTGELVIGDLELGCKIAHRHGFVDVGVLEGEKALCSYMS